MNRHALILITTGKQELEELTAAVSRLDPEDADAMFLREKHRGAAELVRWYEGVTRAAPGLPVYINDRLDAAAAAGAPGVQLGYASLPPEAARRILPPGTRIGVSVHSQEEAVRAREAGADYVLYGHIFATASKAGVPPRGTDGLRQVVDAAELPVIAIGGITPALVPEVLATGCSGIAVLSGVLLQADPGGALKRYRLAMEQSPGRPRFPWNSVSLPPLS